MKTLLSAATALAIIVGDSAAFADSGDGPQFGVPQPVPATGSATVAVTAAPLATDVNDSAEPVFAGVPATIDENGGGGFLPQNGDAAPVQTANSAPPGFGVDTEQLAARAEGGYPHFALGFPLFAIR